MHRLKNIVETAKLIASAVVLSVAPSLMAATPVAAANVNSLYSYALDGSGASSANLAAANTSVPMTLHGNWSQTAFGVQFTGNTTNGQSVGYAKPTSGATVNVPATEAFGASVLLKYQAPQTTTCFSDSPNITQVGKWGTGQTQFKLQLSNCGDSQSFVYPQCRVAGTLAGNDPVEGTRALTNGETYLLECVKSPDPVSGSATVDLKLTHITPTGNMVYTDSFLVTPTGNLTSTQYVSVANKYPLPAQASNTDQFNGQIAKVAYCKGGDVAAAKTCLAQENPAPTPPTQPASFVDEVHFAYGDTDDEIVFNWRGTEDTIYFGTTAQYGQHVTAIPSPITPWDITGPFWEAHLTGLAPDTTYHYKVGAEGTDKTFRSKPAGDFTWVDIGDTKSSYCAPWMTGQHALIAAQNPHFVTHGGDIGLLNECGIPSTHSYYTDQEAWSHSAAFQPAWGNHEYGQPTPHAPVGTPRDSLANYKGRSWITNAQTVPLDTATRTSNPGCGEESNSQVNLCQGRDWGWFRTGNVVFISYPENWTNGWADWQIKAGAIMATAQADETVDFIVTYGHRPPYTSSGEGPNLTIRSTVEALAAQYSPTPANPNGKYILNVAHHAHSQEAFNPIQGLTHVVDAAGGQGFTNFTNIDPNSAFRSMHFGILKADYDASDHKLTVNLVCGAEYTTVKDPCNYGDVIYTTTFQRGSQPGPAILQTTVTDNDTQIQVGETATYTVQVSNTQNAQTASGTNVSLQLPANYSITNAGGGTQNGNTVSWNIGNLASGQQANYQVIATLQSGTANQQLTATATTTAANGCTEPTSACTATDTTTVYIPPTFTEWITNPSVETNMTGWTGAYGGSSVVQISHDTTVSRTGTKSIKVTGLAGANNKQSGINANPRWITSATAGATYTGRAWVKTQAANQSVTLLLREWNGSTMVGEGKVTVTSTGTDWFELTAPITAQANGTSISFAVYGNDVDAGEYFYIDDFSLTSPQ